MALSALSGDVVDISAIVRNIEDDLGDAHEGALLEAVRAGDVPAVRKALDSLHGHFSMRAKLLAAEKRDACLLRVLLESNDVIDESLVEAACYSKDPASIAALLDFGLRINEPLNPDQYVLWTAVDDITFARFLVGVGADVDCKSRYNVSALSVAIAHGCIDVVRFLISERVDVTQGDLLHCAAVRENQIEGAELVEELAQKGANVNAHSFDNAVEAPFQKRRTPLHVAVQQENIAVARALIRHGADPNKMCTQALEPVGPTALEDAKAKNQEAMIKLLSS
ncbi:hypothetical protein DOTSEDRAFT_83026 [Dothistroma septosporum NZE10]|uniref:Uncharacterized protein n=1 Tax=Dothistroma septosporum (strain NZE10 / CBS 128990) TaxID=675120 RepID=M2WJM9_DOTSN|nr:hypothetical protein DOTSEDRAFT_83026 [Dothistroma septosporum NZE10]